MSDDRDALVLDALALHGRVTDALCMFHMVLRQAQAAYAAGLRDGPDACMEWLGNALAGPGLLPSEGADPQWYSEDAWTEGPPWQPVPAANATISEPPAAPSPCDTLICTWTAGWGTEGVPAANRKQIDVHVASHVRLVGEAVA